jgi:hypothetical protein
VRVKVDGARGRTAVSTPLPITALFRRSAIGAAGAGLRLRGDCLSLQRGLCVPAPLESFARSRKAGCRKARPKQVSDGASWSLRQAKPSVRTAFSHLTVRPVWAKHKKEGGGAALRPPPYPPGKVGSPEGEPSRFPSRRDRNAKRGRRLDRPSQMREAHRLSPPDLPGTARSYPGSPAVETYTRVEQRPTRDESPEGLPSRPVLHQGGRYGLTPPALALRYPEQIARNPMAEPFFRLPSSGYPAMTFPRPMGVKK